MKLVHMMIGSALALAAGTAQAAPDASGEQRLAKLTAGRVAGAPVDCINQRDVQSSEIVSGTAIVYTGRNGTIYVNRPEGSASFLRRDDILLTRNYTSQLCSIDIVTLIDRTSQFQTGSFGLSQFIPYPRPPKAAKQAGK